MLRRPFAAASSGGGLSSGTLKALAAVLMLLDHAGKLFQPWLLAGLRAALPLPPSACFSLLWGFLGAGRMSAVLFFFLSGESCRYTKHRLRYVRNLFLFGAASEIPYQMFTACVDGEQPVPHVGCTNVMFTLLLGALACFGWQEAVRRGWGWAGLLPPVLCAAAAYALHTDYGPYGVAAVFCCFYAPHRQAQQWALGAIFFFLYAVRFPAMDLSSGALPWHMAAIYAAMTAYALAAVLLLSRYRGRHRKRGRYFFYAFYPAHLLALTILYRCVMR